MQCNSSTIILLFRQNICVKIIFTQTKLNFTSHVWWALIEDIALHVEKVAGEKEMACGVRGYQVYNDIWQQQLGKCWCVVAGVSSSGKFSL